MDKNESMFKQKVEMDDDGNLKPLDVSYEELEDLRDKMYWEDPRYNSGYLQRARNDNNMINPTGNGIVQSSRPLGTITREIYEDFGKELKINFLVKFLKF